LQQGGKSKTENALDCKTYCNRLFWGLDAILSAARNNPGRSIPLGEDLIMKSVFKSCASFAALSLASLSASAYAAEQAPAAAQPASDDGLNAIVVTASTGDKSKLNSSISISSVSASTIADFRPNSQGDLLRLLPGLQPNISGPGGNGNFAVRGLPVYRRRHLCPASGRRPAAGSVRRHSVRQQRLFHQVRRADRERGRGARRTAATMASQAPGAVINYISKTSKSEGGFVELEKGEF
jgi:outer membrane receptor for ferrienterochelin and colicin